VTTFTAYRDALQPLLHTLKDGDWTHCGIWAISLNRVATDLEVAQMAKCKECWTGLEFSDVHTEHCCAEHGCKYAYKSELCTVTQGIAKQSYPCEVCSFDEEEMEARGEHYEYAVTDGKGTILPTDKDGSSRHSLLNHSSWKLVRRRVSEWEEVER